MRKIGADFMPLELQASVPKNIYHLLICNLLQQVSEIGDYLPNLFVSQRINRI